MKNLESNFKAFIVGFIFMIIPNIRIYILNDITDLLNPIFGALGFATVVIFGFMILFSVIIEKFKK